MQNLLIVTVLVVLSVGNAAAAELSTKMASQYVGTGGGVLVNKAVQQTNLFIPLSGGFYADIWNSLAVEGDEKEIDWTAGWSGSLATLSVDLGVSYYDCGQLFASQDDIVNPYFEISKLFKLSASQSLTPSVRIESPILVADWSLAGTFTHVGVKHVWQATERLSLAQTVKVVHDNGAYDMDSGFIGKYSASLNVAATKSITLNASVDISKPFGSINDRELEVTPNIGVVIRF